MTEPEAQAGGFMHLLPTYLPAGLNVTGISFAMLPWLSPAYSGLAGTTQGDPPTPALVVTFEWPIPWIRTTEPLPQFDREWLYLRRYSADQALATGSHAYAQVEPGADPPDATAITDDGRIGVESTALTIQDRRAVHGLFLRLRTQVRQQEPAAFANLLGHVAYVWFQEDGAGGLQKPYKRSESKALDALVRELSEYEPRTQQLWLPDGPLPEKGPELPVVEAEPGAKFYAIPIQAAAPSTMLFATAGFELGLAYTTILTREQAWDEVQRLIQSHDEPGVDLLVISAGAPDQNGLVYPAEEALADFLIANPLPLGTPPEHIKRVVLHSWMSGRATSVHPEISELFGPLYQSFVNEHHPLNPVRSVPGQEPTGQ